MEEAVAEAPVVEEELTGVPLNAIIVIESHFEQLKQSIGTMSEPLAAKVRARLADLVASV